MKHTFDLSELKWTLTGWIPEFWRAVRTMETGAVTRALVHPVPARVPGSVQGALRDAGLLPDWNVGLNYQACEWVENRHWIYEAVIPDDWFTQGNRYRLNCLGLDYSGLIFVNGQEAGSFEGTFVPHRFDITPLLRETDNSIKIVFTCPPRWLGQCGWTSKFTEWKPRFNYTWDWTPRLVQLGVWDSILLESTDAPMFDTVRCKTDVATPEMTGSLRVWGAFSGVGASSVRLRLAQGDTVLVEKVCGIDQFTGDGIRIDRLNVDLWWPNQQGEQPLYDLTVQLLDEAGFAADSIDRRIGVKTVTWQQCEGAPPEAEPWICVINGRPVFLQGVNWTPIRPNFADVTDEDYRDLLTTYRDMGCNVLRVWGGAVLEKEIFYNLCDELGLLVWQEFPLSSSYLDNWPPEDEKSIGELAEIARSYIARRQHHACLLLWCGGNELQGALDGGKVGIGKPIDNRHPLMTVWRDIVAEEDPGRRFLPSSASGPRFFAQQENFGKGLHHDVHGPWAATADLDECRAYWEADDALFRSEVGAPGASPLDIIAETIGDLPELPASAENALWRRPNAWTESDIFEQLHGHPPNSLAEYVEWSQARQAEVLNIAARACKKRFPGIGGIIIWMGHDAFPCAANTSIIDFHARPKPAALALRRVFRDEE